MKKVLLFACGAVLAIQADAQVHTDNNLQGRVDSIVQKAALAFMKNPGKVALSVGVIYNGAFYKYNYGETSPGSGNLPSPGTLYEIGSITKTFTTLLLAHALAEKRIGLNDDIRKYLKGDYPNLRYANGQKVKIAYLVSHVARFPRNVVPIDSPLTDNDFYKALHAVKLDTLQPYRFSYSNFGYQLLGHILENVYGLPYDRLVKKYITGPLDMPETRIYPAEQVSLIRGYNADKKRMPDVQVNYPAAGSLRSNINDMLKYAAAQLNEQDMAVRLTHQVMFYSDDNADAMSWSVGRTRNWDYFQREDGGTRGFRTFIALFPDYNAGIVLLANETDNDAGRQLWNMVLAIFNGLKE